MPERRFLSWGRNKPTIKESLTVEKPAIKSDVKLDIPNSNRLTQGNDTFPPREIFQQ